jgi:hypothetical protein
MNPFNALSIAATVRKILPLKEASPAKVMSCALIASIDIQKDLDATKEVTGGAGAPSTKMASRPANSPGRPWFVANQSPVKRVDHHQRAKVPPVLEVMERAQLVVFPLVRRLGRGTDRSRLHVPLWGSSLRGR